MPIKIVNYSRDLAKNAHRRERQIYAVDGKLEDLTPSVDYALYNPHGATFPNFSQMGRCDDQYIFRDGIVRVRNLKHIYDILNRPEFVEVRADKVIPHDPEAVAEWLEAKKPDKPLHVEKVFRLIDGERLGGESVVRVLLATSDELTAVRAVMDKDNYPHLLNEDNSLYTHSVWQTYLLTRDERLWCLDAYEKKPWELYPAEEKHAGIYSHNPYDVDKARAVLAKYAHFV